MPAAPAVTARLSSLAVLVCFLFSPGCTRDAGITIGDESARACDLTIDTGALADVPVRFAGGVRGQASQRAPHLGVSFVATRDAPLTPRAVRLEATAPAAVRIVSASCFDAHGTLLSQPRAQVE